MTPEKQKEIIQLYANLMAEIKIRIESVGSALEGKMGVPSPFIREFCFLQLRMICELIALSCLTAHGDIALKLKKEYSAEKIMRKLEELNPNFYPKPETQRRTGPNAWHYEPVESGYITKEELLKLYGKCGDVLHRGSIKKLLKSQMPIQHNFPEIDTPIRKIIKLLSMHRISLKGGEWQLLAMLQNASDNNRVQVALASLPQPSEISNNRKKS